VSRSGGEAPHAELLDAADLGTPGLAALAVRYRRQRSAGPGWDEVACTLLDGPDVVAGVLHDPETGMVALVRQIRPGPLLAGRRGYDGACFLHEIVAGILDPGRPPSDMMRQEVREETGLEPVAIEPVAVAFVNPALSAARAHFFLVTVRCGRPENRPPASFGRADEQEDISVVLVPAEEIPEWIAGGRIVDTLSLSGLLLAMPRLEAARTRG
jgi:ADP-ribose pyrophosphatase YjhB (NUDIX family)